MEGVEVIGNNVVVMEKEPRQGRRKRGQEWAGSVVIRMTNRRLKHVIDEYVESHRRRGGDCPQE